MSGYPFSKNQLKNAARIYSKRRTDALRASLDREPVEFSPEFQRKIKSICSAADAAKKRRRRIRTRAAAAIIALIVLITAFFSFNTTARAEFINWIKDVYKEFVAYHFSGEKSTDELPDLVPGWIPYNFDLTGSNIDEMGLYYLYESPDKSSGFDLSCAKAHSGSAIFVGGHDDRQHLSLTISGYEVDCYVSADADSDYVWHDAEGKFFFSMNSSLPHETNLRIIENLKIVTK